jgi:hypothetical protein
MSSALLKVDKNDGGAILNARYKWVEWTTESDDENEVDPVLIRCRVRSSLVNREIEALSGLSPDDPLKDIWEHAAPYVVEWNVMFQDGEDLYKVLPPAEAGPEAFQYAPPELAMAIIGSLIREPFRAVDPKSSTPVESTVAR